MEKNTVKYSEAKNYPKEKHLAKTSVLNVSLWLTVLLSYSQNGAWSREMLACMLLYVRMFFEGNSSVSSVTRNAMQYVNLFLVLLFKQVKQIHKTYMSFWHASYCFLGTAASYWNLFEMMSGFFVIEYAYFTCWRLKHTFFWQALSTDAHAGALF